MFYYGICLYGCYWGLSECIQDVEYCSNTNGWERKNKKTCPFVLYLCIESCYNYFEILMARTMTYAKDYVLCVQMYVNGVLEQWDNTTISIARIALNSVWNAWKNVERSLRCS